MSSLRVLLMSTVAVLLVHEGETIKCWECEVKAETAGCGDPFLESVMKNQSHITQCPIESKACMKLTGETDEGKYVLRGCAPATPNYPTFSCLFSQPGQTIPFRKNILTVLTCDVCAGDSCNGAARLGAVAVLLAPLLVLSCLYLSH